MLINLRKISREQKHKDRMNKRGQVMMINLLFLLMTVAVMIALIPEFNTLLNMAQQSNALNCQGYYFNGDVNNTLSYNSTLPTNVLACLSIDLYLPYIIMAVLIAGVSRVLLGRITTDSGI
jgi:L-lactate permease